MKFYFWNSRKCRTVMTITYIPNFCLLGWQINKTVHLYQYPRRHTGCQSCSFSSKWHNVCCWLQFKNLESLCLSRPSGFKVRMITHFVKVLILHQHFLIFVSISSQGFSVIRFLISCSSKESQWFNIARTLTLEP